MISACNRPFLIVSLILFVQIVTAQEINLSTFKKLSPDENFERRCKGRKKIKRINKNNVTLSFFQDFSDSIIIYVDHKEAVRKFLEHDSMLVSTDFTGYMFSNEYTKRKTTITIVYLNEKSYTRFELNRNFPLYSLHFYRNKFYAVAARKCIMEIK